MLQRLEGVHAKPGRVIIEVEFTDDLSPYKLPAGASGTTVVCTGKWHAIQIIRMVILRICAHLMRLRRGILLGRDALLPVLGLLGLAPGLVELDEPLRRS